MRFRFVSRPEYLTIGTRLIIREGTSKGFGFVTNIFPYTNLASADDYSSEVLSSSSKSYNKNKLSPNRTPPSPRARKMAKIDPADSETERNTENKDPATAQND